MLDVLVVAMMNLIVFAGAVPLGYAKELDDHGGLWEDLREDSCSLGKTSWRTAMHRSHGRHRSESGTSC